MNDAHALNFIEANASALLAATVTLTNVTSGWQTFPLTNSLALINGNYYWLAIWSDDVNASISADTGGQKFYAACPFGNRPNPISLTGSGGFTYCIYATGQAQTAFQQWKSNYGLAANTPATSDDGWQRHSAPARIHLRPESADEQHRRFTHGQIVEQLSHADLPENQSRLGHHLHRGSVEQPHRPVAQKDTARELSSKLASLKGIVWVGVVVFLFGLASIFYPPLKLIIGSVTTSVAITVGGVALMILPSLIVGNELLILSGVGVAVGVWFFADRHGQLRGLVGAAKNVVETKQGDL